MSFLTEAIESEEFAALSNEDKGNKSKELFKETLTRSDSLRSEFESADKEGRNAMLTNFRGALLKKFPEQYSKKVTRKIVESRTTPGTGVIGGPPKIERVTVDKEFNLPLLTPSQEGLVERIESGDITPEKLNPESKDLKDFSEEEVANVAGFINFTNQLSQEDNPHLSKEQRDAFKKFGNDLIMAKGGKSLTDEQLLAGGKAALGLHGIKELVLDPIGRTYEKIASGLEGEELEAHLKELEDLKKEHTDLELAVRGEEIQTAKTVGALIGLVGGGVAAGTALPSAAATATSNIGRVLAAEGTLAAVHGPNLPSFAVEAFDIDPKSKTATLLNFAEGSAFAALGTLLTKGGRALAREGFREIMTKLETPKLVVDADKAEALRLAGPVEGQKLLPGPTIESLQEAARSDAKIMAEHYGIPEEDAFNIIDEAFGQPVMARRDVIDPGMTKQVQSPEALDKLNARLRAEEVGDPISKVEVDPSIVKQSEDLQAPIDMAVSKSRVSATNEAVTTAERRALRASQLEEAAQAPKTAAELAAEKKAIKQGLKKSSAELELQELEEAFSGVNINKNTAAKINMIENTDALTRAEKNELISAARNDPKALASRTEDVMAHKAADPSISDAAKAKALEFQERLAKPVKRAISGHDVAQAKASVALAQDVDDLAKMNKAQINNFLVKPLGKTQLKKTTKTQILDQFEIEKTRAVQDEASRIEIQPKQPERGDSLVKLKENDAINSPKTDAEYTPTPDSKARFDADIDSPQNPNRVPAEGKPLTEGDIAARKETQAANEETLGVDPMPDDVPQAVQEAHQQLLDLFTKQFVGGKAGPGILDGQTYKNLATVGAHLIGKGFNRFGSWSKEMVNRYGKAVKGNLGDIWDASKNMFQDPRKQVLKGMKAVDETFGITAPRTEPLSKAVARNKAVKGFDHITSPISTRIKRMNKRVFGEINLMEFAAIKRAGDAVKASEKFIKGMDILSGHSKGDPRLFKEVNRAFMNADSHAAKELILDSEMDGKLKDMLIDGIDDVRKELDKFHVEAREAGLDVGYLEDYFPRVVKDHKGMMKYLGKDPALKSKVDTFLDAESAKLKRELSTAERGELINRFLLDQASEGKTSKLGFEQKRKINEVSRELSQFYGNTHENIIQYFGQGYDRLAKQKLFGRADKIPVTKKRSPHSFVDYSDESLGKWIAQNSKKMNPKDVDELVDLIKTRFIQGDATADDWVQNLRNLGYIGTMGKWTNAITQIGDLALAMQEHPKDFLKGTKNTILNSDEGVKTVQLGINKIQEDVAKNPLTTGKMLDKIFSLNGLRWMDKFGKDVFLGSAYAKFQRLSKQGGKGLEKLKAEHTELFGEEFTDKLIKDLKAGKRSYEVDAALFNNLTGVQPITKSEMPAAYLNHPNGRIFYMLKSYALKQLDRVRRDGVDELIDAVGMARHDPKGAAKKSATALTKISSIVLGGTLWEAGTSDLLKDALRGREVDTDSVSDAAHANLWRLFFMNKHLKRSLGAKHEGFAQQLLGDFTPPVVGLIDDALADANSALEGDLTFGNSQLTYSIPLGGDFVWWYGEQGTKRKKELLEERKLKKHPLFTDIEDTKTMYKRESKVTKENINADLLAIDDLEDKREQVRYIKKAMAVDPEYGNTLKNAYKRKVVRERRGLTPEEVKFTGMATDVKVTQLFNHLGTFRTADEKVKEYNRLRKKGIITRSVARKLRPLLRGE